MKSECCDYVRVLNAELQYVSIEVTRAARFYFSRFNEQLNEVIRDAQSNHLLVIFRFRNLLLAILPSSHQPFITLLSNPTLRPHFDALETHR